MRAPMAHPLVSDRSRFRRCSPHHHDVGHRSEHHEPRRAFARARDPMPAVQREVRSAPLRMEFPPRSRARARTLRSKGAFLVRELRVLVDREHARGRLIQDVGVRRRAQRRQGQRESKTKNRRKSVFQDETPRERGATGAPRTAVSSAGPSLHWWWGPAPGDGYADIRNDRISSAVGSTGFWRWSL